MAKFIIKIGAGTFETGFDANLTINQEGETATAAQSVKLVPAPHIPQLYKDWKSAYYKTPVIRQALRIQIPETQETNVSIQKCRDAADALVYQMIQWHEQSMNLQRLIEKRVRSDEPMRVFIQTDNVDIWKLPWHLWSLLTDHPNSELAFITDNFHNISSVSLGNSVKILGILGNDEKIQIEEDRRLVEALRDTQIEWLQKPSISDVVDKLIEGSWDILFFAGHSYTNTQNQGVIQINDRDSLFLTDLKYVLKIAVAKGLKLAIFNSCDGTGLAKDLADLNIPYILVMKEPVPDRVAQLFLKYFLEQFSKGKSLNQSVEYARERLRIDEATEQLPGASWLPLIYQNPNLPSLIWIQPEPQVPPPPPPEPPVSLPIAPNPIWIIWLNKWGRIPKNTRVAIALFTLVLLSIILIKIVILINSKTIDERISIADKSLINDKKDRKK